MTLFLSVKLKVVLPLTSVLLLFSCKGTQPLTITTLKQAQRAICGHYATPKELTSGCQLKLTIRRKKTGYRYRLRTSKHTYRGSAFCVTNNPKGFYFQLERLPWCYNNGLLNDTLPPPDRTDLRLYCTGDTLVFQNYGNVMNDYMILCECGQKYVELVKR